MVPGQGAGCPAEVVGSDGADASLDLDELLGVRVGRSRRRDGGDDGGIAVGAERRGADDGDASNDLNVPVQCSSCTSGNLLNPNYVDAAGNAFITGYTSSDSFPTTPGAFDEVFNGVEDVFVTKLNAAGTGLAYSTFFGGSHVDNGYGVRVNAAGQAHLIGYTASADFPTTAGAFDQTLDGATDGFVIKLNDSGTGLIYSTLLGGANNDFGYGIDMDESGNVYATGYTHSSDFPTTPGVLDETHNGFTDAFVTKLNSDASALEYSTYMGSSNYDFGEGIRVDALGCAYIAASSEGRGFPTTPDAFDKHHNGSRDVILAKLQSDGSALEYSTYLGGRGSDWVRDMDLDDSGHAYIAGLTSSCNLPMTASARDPIFTGRIDAFVTMLNSTGSGLTYATFLGGSDEDEGRGIALDSSGNMYVAGTTYSHDFPTMAGAFDETQNGYGDAFVTKLSPPPCAAPTVSGIPDLPVACPGSDLEWTVTAGGYDPFSFQWYKDGMAMPGETQNSLMLTSLSMADEGAYYCEVSGPCGTTVTNLAMLVVDDALRAEIVPGSGALGLDPPTFDVVVQCAIANHQTLWTADPPTTLIASGDSVTLDPPPAVNTRLEAMVTDELERVVVAEAWLLVAQNSEFHDFNGDGFNHLQDIRALVPFWAQVFAGDPDGDGNITVLDFLYINMDDTAPCP